MALVEINYNTLGDTQSSSATLNEESAYKMRSWCIKGEWPGQTTCG